MSLLSTATAGRVVGGLVLSGFFLYGGGSYLVASTTNAATPLPENAASVGQLSAGACLMLLNSAVVIGIGVLASRVLRRRHPRTATSYRLTRIVEGTLLAIPAASILALAFLEATGAATSGGDSWLTGLARSAVENRETSYWVAMAVLGAGSVVFCRTLLISELLPRLLAIGGMVGYAIFAVGSVLQLSGYPVGLVLSAPGGLFEVAAGSYLLVKGLREVAPLRPATVDPSAAAAALGQAKAGTSR
jgi:hypothetical protein